MKKKENMKINILVYFSFFLSEIYNADGSRPIVPTIYGNIHGITIKTLLGRTISGFLGIPYAVPPLGKLR